MMKFRYWFGIVAAASVLLFSCSSPMSPGGAASSGGSTGTPTGSSLLSVQNVAGQALLVTGTGDRIDIAAETDSGALVNCVSAKDVVRYDEESGGGGSSSDAVIVGSTRDRGAGVWVYSSGKVEPVIDETTGKLSCVLPGTDEADGAFRGHLGWTYYVKGTSSDGRIIVGYAENKNGISIGRWKIEPGTTIGVYWRVSRHSDHRHLSVSSARIIGTFGVETKHNGGFWKRGWIGRVRQLILNQLKFLLFNYLSSYLTTVDDNGIYYDAQKHLYSVFGTDQDGYPAVALISRRGTITIMNAESGPITTGTVDLAPGAMTVDPTEVTQGGSVTVQVPVQNLGPGRVTGSFPVDIHLASTSTFNPSSDDLLDTVWIGGIDGSTTADAQATVSLTVPTAGQTYYLYSVVDPDGTVVDANSTNNVSTPSNAAAVLVQSAGGTASKLLVETYDPTGGTGTASIGIALFLKQPDGTLSCIGSQFPYTPATFGSLDYTSSGLEPGTYYALVTQDGPFTGQYAFQVHDPATPRETFGPIYFDPDPSNNNTIPGLSVSAPTTITGYTGAAPTNALSVGVGTAVNWYVGAGGLDWFTFTVP